MCGFEENSLQDFQKENAFSFKNWVNGKRRSPGEQFAAPKGLPKRMKGGIKMLEENSRSWQKEKEGAL